MKHRVHSLLIIGALTAAPLYFVESPLYARVIAITAICLFVWISQLAPPIVPTLLLWTLVPIAIYPIDPRFSLQSVLTWAVDPVMALFFGGFTLGAAAEVYGLDNRLAAFALRSAGRSFSVFLLLIVFITAFFSMWLSNIAAAALVLACLRPVLREFRDDHMLRRTLLIGVALGADFGGIATPIGTGQCQVFRDVEVKKLFAAKLNGFPSLWAQLDARLSKPVVYSLPRYVNSLAYLLQRHFLDGIKADKFTN